MDSKSYKEESRLRYTNHNPIRLIGQDMLPDHHIFAEEYSNFVCHYKTKFLAHIGHLKHWSNQIRLRSRSHHVFAAFGVNIQ